jgi:hypothetical protein
MRLRGESRSRRRQDSSAWPREWTQAADTVVTPCRRAAPAELGNDPEISAPSVSSGWCDEGRS